MFDVRFDLVCSFGGNCACAMLLDDAGLRMSSSPFDWLCGASLGQNVKTLGERFARFTRRENIVWKEAGCGDRSNDVYRDVEDGHCCVHDFPKGMTLDESFPLVRAKYGRRIARLLKTLDEGHAVCLVWREIGGVVPADACEDAVRRIRRAFPRSDVWLLVFENDPMRPVGERFALQRLADGLCVKAVGRIFAEGYDEMLGDRAAQLKVLKMLQCSPSLERQRRAHVLRRGIVRFVSLWHFDREARKLARERWTQRLCRKGGGPSVGW